MKLGILSDTHNNHEKLNRALDLFGIEGVTTLIHCGDMTAPQTAALMTGFRVIHVTGNMDVSPGSIRRTLISLNPNSFSGPSFSGELEGIPVASAHGHIPERLDELVQGGRFDYVFYGHSHRRHDEWMGQTRVINPGALGGIRYETPSICVLDLTSGDTRFIEVGER